ncbi:MAG TPA: phytoene desaturase [Bacteroidetes bacterium]|nr:phytoene desaturase [Bacteroidota bacterium]HRK04399.1 phytoene desaturase [Chlorobiota bacterium]
MKVVVIGSGFGGLTAAIRLQAKGYDVEIVERRDKPGGRAYVYEQDGFTFDGGPTIITAPWLIHDLFTLCGKHTEDYVSIVPIDPFYNVRFEDGSVFRYTGKREEVIEEIRRFNPADVRGYERFFEKTADIFTAGFNLIDRPFSKLTDMVRVLPDLIRLRSQDSVAKFVNRHIKDDRLRQVFSFHPLLVGGNPFRTTSIYALIHKLEQEWGVWFAMGGTGALVRALVKLFTDIGGTIRLNADVQEILIDDTSGGMPAARGIRLADGTEIRADIVISNGDVARTYMSLVPKQYRRKNTNTHLEKLTYSMSLFVIYFGTNRRYDNLAHHEILMGPRYEGLVEDIFTKKVLAKDFSLYLHRPTATDPSLAPDGCDAWYVLSPVPHLGSGTDWSVEAPRYRDAIFDYLEERYMPNLRQHIVTEHHIDPVHFDTTLASHLGSAFSVEPTLFQSAWWRPHNESEDIRNLYFVGAGTHPGAGLPGVMSSGAIAARQIAARTVNTP